MTYREWLTSKQNRLLPYEGWGYHRQKTVKLERPWTFDDALFASFFRLNYVSRHIYET